jgi:hypothetical protein
METSGLAPPKSTPYSRGPWSRRMRDFHGWRLHEETVVPVLRANSVPHGWGKGTASMGFFPIARHASWSWCFAITGSTRTRTNRSPFVLGQPMWYVIRQDFLCCCPLRLGINTDERLFKTSTWTSETRVEWLNIDRHAAESKPRSAMAGHPIAGQAPARRGPLSAQRLWQAWGRTGNHPPKYARTDNFVTFCGRPSLVRFTWIRKSILYHAGGHGLELLNRITCMRYSPTHAICLPSRRIPALSWHSSVSRQISAREM